MTFSIPGVWATLGPADRGPTAADLPADQTVATESARVGVVQGSAHLCDDGLIAAISGNYYWLDREISDMALRHNAKNALTFAYHRYGERLLDKLAGRFSLVVWDERQRRGLAATDHFGVMPVYWTENAQTTAIAPTADQALQLSGRPSEVSTQGLYNYLFFHMVPSPGTIYNGINKLPAAYALRLRDGKPEPFCYWMPDFAEGRQANATRPSGSEMLQLLQTAVAQLDDGEHTGAFLSGGLDSSTVAGLLAQHRANPSTFSIGFDAKGYDEIEYARIASRHFQTNPFEYYVTPEDVLDALPKVAAAYDEPFGNSSAIPAYFCARFAKENGMTRLLAGDGGDELYAGNERYAKQTVFEAYRVMPGPARRYLLNPLARHLPKSGLLGKAASYINQAQIPLPARLHSYNFLTRFPATEMFADAFIEQVDTEQPSYLESEVYNRPQPASRLDRMLYLDWQFTLADNDLRKVNRMCQLAGIEVEYPMLDDLVVAHSTRISSWEKMRFNRLRDFYKRGVSEFLPERIINKSKHGFGLPFGVWMSDHAGLQGLARESLEHFGKREIIRPAFIEQLMRLHAESHAGYYGEMVWLLVMLELWLSTHNL